MLFRSKGELYKIGSKVEGHCHQFGTTNEHLLLEPRQTEKWQVDFHFWVTQIFLFDLLDQQAMCLFENAQTFDILVGTGVHLEAAQLIVAIKHHQVSVEQHHLTLIFFKVEPVDVLVKEVAEAKQVDINPLIDPVLWHQF